MDLFEKPLPTHCATEDWYFSVERIMMVDPTGTSQNMLLKYDVYFIRMTLANAYLCSLFCVVPIVMEVENPPWLWRPFGLSLDPWILDEFKMAR